MNPVPSRMKAAVSRRYGKPGVVRIEEVDTPSPAPGQILVRVRATTVNRTDCGYRGAAPFLIRFFSGIRRPKTLTWGTEFAGEVVGLGEGATRFAIGERIAGWCEGTFGAHAEYLTVAERRLIARIPEGWNFQEAAPSTEGSHYALAGLRLAKMQPGMAVLVYGASGAIGSAAVQLAKLMGFAVTAVCGTAALDRVRALGPDRVIDYQTQDITTPTERYDLVFDAVGKLSYRTARRLLKPKGVYCPMDRPLLHTRFMFVPVFLNWLVMSLLTRLFGGKRMVFIGPGVDREGVAWLTERIESGEFRPLIDRTYPLDQIVAAYRFVESGQKVGNVVIAVA